MASTPAPQSTYDHAEVPRWRERLIPRTILGMVTMLVAAATGAAFSGAVLYSYYEYRLTTNEERVAKFTQGFEEQYDNAIGNIKAERDAAKSDIKKELEPLTKTRADGETLKDVAKKVSPSVWFVRSLDEAGQPSVGSAFVVASDSNQTLLLTSYNTIRAGTRKPGPEIFVRQGEEERKATLWTWQEDKDLALLIVDKGKQPKLSFAPGSPPLETGDRIFSLSGLGATGGAISQGFVADVFNGGIQHDAPVGPSFQGGPLVNSKGEVVGLASRAYAPLGFATDAVFFGVPIRAACDKVLKCPDGEATGAGEKR